MSGDNLEIFDDRKSMLVVWQTLMDRAYSHLKFLLETTRFYFLLISALLTIYAVVAGIEMKSIQIPWKIFSLGFLSLFIIFFAKIGSKTLRRQYSRFLEFVAYLAKVEEIIGLSNPKKTEIFKEDEYLFNRFVKKRKLYDSSNAFIEGELEKKDKLYWDMRLVYKLFMLIGVILMILTSFSVFFYFKP